MILLKYKFQLKNSIAITAILFFSISNIVKAQFFEFNTIIKSTYEEPPISFFENGNIINAQFDNKNQILKLQSYNGIKPLKNKYQETEYIKINYKGIGFKGFCKYENKLVLLFFGKLLLYEKNKNQYQLIDSINTKFSKLHSKDGKYFVLSNYYNHMDSLVNDIEFNGYKIKDNKFVKSWEYNERYPFIYYSHLAGNFLDINSKNEFLVCYSKSNQILVFNENGSNRLSKDFVIGKIDSIHEKKNMESFNDINISIKQKIYTLKQNDTIGLRIQNVKFIDINNFYTLKTNSKMNQDFVLMDLWKRFGETDSFHIIKHDIKYRVGFHQEPQNKKFELLIPLSNTSPFYIYQNNIMFWDVYIPKKITKSNSLNQAQEKLEKYYSNRKITYGLYLFKIK